MGEKATRICGDVIELLQETLNAMRAYHTVIKGPFTNPTGSGICALNTTLRQLLGLYVSVYVADMPSPLQNPEWTDMVVFRENSEDIYAGIEWPVGTHEADQLIQFFANAVKG